MLTDRERTKALGNWGEAKALALLQRAGFSKVRDMNAESMNHPFGDIHAERLGVRYMIGVKTRNKYQVSGLLNRIRPPSTAFRHRFISPSLMPIGGVVRARSVHKVGYGHNCDWAAA
jgi:hypothetical protein